jgi:polyhydroxyalkanoate synthase subunit PhaC
MACTVDKLFCALHNNTASNEVSVSSPLVSTNLLFDVAPGLAQAYAALLQALAQHPDTVARTQKDYVEAQSSLWQQLCSGAAVPNAANTDRRFAAPEWQTYPLFQYVQQSYALAARALTQAVETAQIDAASKKKLQFFLKQNIDAVAPSNFLVSNPEALRKCWESQGASLAAGMQNLSEDLQRGRISMTDESAFEVGRNLALTPGEVVFENELMQLIQYRPVTEQVHARPIVFVPPAINKFYIMDLQPDNSFVRWAVEQGQTVFLVSWRNVDEAQQHLTWDAYLEDGVTKAVEVARSIGKSEQVNLLGFCVGGTIAGCALAVMAARGQDWVASLTLMTALLDFSEVGDIGVFVDEHFVEQREQEFKDGGLLHGRELSMAFSSLRSNELIWNYVVDNYLKGGKPPAFDLLYWNSDSTNLPGPMYAYYLRHAYLQNELVQPGKLNMCGVKLDLRKIDVPAFVFAAIEDHIVPWRGAYRSGQALSGTVEFVLGASGHIAGSMNSAYRNKRHFWRNSSAGGVVDPDAWLGKAEQTSGSWWPYWTKWLAKHSGKMIPAPRKPGSRSYPAIEPAPGRYVKQRAT